MPGSDSLNIAPVVLFVYNRLNHVQQTIAALQRNELASESELYIFSDGPRSDSDRNKVDSVREYLQTVTGFRKCAVIARDTNLGLARSVITGVTDIVCRCGRIIVLEDDMVTSPWFLRYMNEALEFYRDNDRVISIHGYIYPVGTPLPETFLLKGADCWGWATWQRGWDLFEPDGQKLLDELRARKLTRQFDYDNTHDYTTLLEEQISGANDSWAIRWHASAFLNDRLTLYPGRSLIRNIGFDESGTHCGASHDFDTGISCDPVRIGAIPLEECKQARKAFKKFFRSLRPTVFQRARNRISRIMNR